VSTSSGRRILVVGSVNSDFSARVREFPRPGETARGESFREGLGGKGANQAVAAVRLGVPATLLTRVGADDRGHHAVRQLRAEGVDVGLISEVAGAQTGAALISVGQSGEKQIIVVPGANDHLTAADVEGIWGALPEFAAIVAQLEVPVESVLAAFRLGKAAGVLTVLDPAPAQPLPDELYRLTDAIKPNRSEGESLTGVPIEDRASARKAADILLARGVGLVFLQAGDEGDLLVTRDGEHWLPRFRVDAVDATGAGDALTAALAVALLEGRPPGEAGRFASAAAALKTTKPGAQPGLPSREAVERLLAAG
jgi:ribokinase